MFLCQRRAFVGLCIATTTSLVGAQKAPAPFRNIPDTALREPGIRQAWTCFVIGGLTERLKGEGPWTVFIPSDEAIGKLEPERAAKLRDTGERALLNFSYHIVRGKLLAADLAKQEKLDTVQGRPLSVASDGSNVTINGSAKIIRPDILCRNGVIHVVDEVLFPVKVKPYRPPPSIVDSKIFRTILFFLLVFAIAWLVLWFRDLKRVRKERRIASRPK